MSALEDLAQAILDGRVSLEPYWGPGSEIQRVDIKVAPAPEPVRPRMSPAQFAATQEDRCPAVHPRLTETLRCSLAAGHDRLPDELGGIVWDHENLQVGLYWNDASPSGEICGVRSPEGFRCVEEPRHPHSVGSDQRHRDGDGHLFVVQP